MNKCGVSTESQLLMCCGVFIFPVYILWYINASKQFSPNGNLTIENNGHTYSEQRLIELMVKKKIDVNVSQ